MDKIIIEAPAKINLTLDVKGKRDDGYHELETVMHPISLVDRLTLTKADDDIRIESNCELLPRGKNNLVYQAAKLFFEKTGRRAGVNVFIEKNIPIGAGLAGGSTNAAGTLLGLNNLYQAHLSPEQLWGLACQLGSDVPFCLIKTSALAQGRGEVLSPLPKIDKLNFLLVKPDFHIATPEIFKKLNLSEIENSPDTKAFLIAWQEYDIIRLASEMVNVLEPVSSAQHPEISAIKNMMKSLGALNAIMSGSGPSVFGVFTDLTQLKNAYQHFKQNYNEVFQVSSYVRRE